MMFRWLVLLAFIAAVPCGVIVGAAIQKNQAAVAAQQAQERHPVRAFVLDNEDVPANAWLVSAAVAWTGADGTRRTATTTVPVNGHARTAVTSGTAVTIWVTSAGRLTTSPLDQDAVHDHAVWGGVLAGLGVPLAAWCVLWIVHRLLDVHRLRQWQADWQAVEPLWTSGSH